MLELILQILGICAIVLFLLIVVGGVAFKLWIKKISGSFFGSFEAPNVEIDPDPKWTKKGLIPDLIKEFEALGFKEEFALKTIFGNSQSLFFSHPDGKVHGALYKIDKVITQEFSAETSDGINVNCSNFEHTELFTLKPNKIIHGYPKASIQELHQHLLDETSQSQLKVVTADKLFEFVKECIEKDHNTSFQDGSHPLWEKEREPFIERYQAFIHDKNPHKLYATFVSENLVNLGYEVDNQLSESEEISAKTYNKYSSNFLLCHPDLDRWGYVFYLEAMGLISKSERRELEKLSANFPTCREILEHLIQAKPQLAITQFHSITEPLAIDLYGYEDDEEH